MEPIDKTHRHCRYFDTFICLLRKYSDLMAQIKLFWILTPNGKVPRVVTADEYLEVNQKCDKVCAGCDKFESKKTD